MNNNKWMVLTASNFNRSDHLIELKLGMEGKFFEFDL